MITNSVLTDIRQLQDAGIEISNDILLAKGFTKVLNLRQIKPITDDTFTCKTGESIFFRFYLYEGMAKKILDGCHAKIVYSIVYEETGDKVLIEQDENLSSGVIIFDWVKNSVIIKPPTGFTNNAANISMEVIIYDDDELIITPAINFKVVQDPFISDVYDQLENDVDTLKEIIRIINTYNDSYKSIQLSLQDIVKNIEDIDEAMDISLDMLHQHETSIADMYTKAVVDYKISLLEEEIDDANARCDLVGEMLIELESGLQAIMPDILNAVQNTYETTRQDQMTSGDSIIVDNGDVVEAGFDNSSKYFNRQGSIEWYASFNFEVYDNNLPVVLALPVDVTIHHQISFIKTIVYVRVDGVQHEINALVTQNNTLTIPPPTGGWGSVNALRVDLDYEAY